MMKKITILFTSLCLIFMLAACKPLKQPSHTQSETIDNEVISSQFSFSKGDAEAVNAVSENSFTKPIKCTYNGKEITITPPKESVKPCNGV